MRKHLGGHMFIHSKIRMEVKQKDNEAEERQFHSHQAVTSSHKCTTGRTEPASFPRLHTLIGLPPRFWWIFFYAMFSSLPFDSLILLLIVPAGQLTKMAALPSGLL